jgi:multidrug efflux pump subunit AcrA (membrane-fusion protein)
MKKCFWTLLLISIFISCNTANKKKDVTDEKAKLEKTANRVVGIGMIVPEKDIIQLSSPVNGIVTKILKSENDSVSLGTPILELDHQLEDAKVNQLISEVATQAAQIKADEAGVSEYEAKYENAVSELRRLQRLLAKGAETQQEVDDANTNLKSFQSNLKRLQAGADVSKSRLNETKAALHVAQIEREQKIILSPVNGRILELTVLIGGSVNTQQSFAQISPEGKTIAVCEIDEMYAEKIATGQKGWIRNVGSIDTLSTGTVYFTYSFLKKKSLFTDQSGEKEDRRVRTIKMLLDQPEKLLLNARIECVIDISDNHKY